MFWVGRMTKTDGRDVEAQRSSRCSTIWRKTLSEPAQEQTRYVTSPRRSRSIARPRDGYSVSESTQAVSMRAHLFGCSASKEEAYWHIQCFLLLFQAFQTIKKAAHPSPPGLVCQTFQLFCFFCVCPLSPAWYSRKIGSVPRVHNRISTP